MALAQYCGHSLVVKCLPSKQNIGVRFPVPAQKAGLKTNVFRPFAICSGHGESKGEAGVPLGRRAGVEST